MARKRKLGRREKDHLLALIKRLRGSMKGSSALEYLVRARREDDRRRETVLLGNRRRQAKIRARQ